MTDEERPYRHHSEREVMEGKRLWEKSYSRFSKQFTAAERVGARDDMDSARRDMDSAHAKMREYARELELRREDRKRGDEERAKQRARRERQPEYNDQSKRSGPRPSPADLTDGALARWFRQLRMEPRDVVIDSINFSWELQGRNYRADYAPADRLLSVSLEVLPGTPGATIVNGASYLPANNPREIGYALEAEKRLRRGR